MAVKVSNLYRCSDWICGEAESKDGLFVDFYADYPQEENPSVYVCLWSTKLNGNPVVVGAMRKRAKSEFKKAIRKAVNEFVFSNGYIPPRWKWKLTEK